MHGLQGHSFRSFWVRLPSLAWLAVIVAAALLSARWLTILLSPRPVAALPVAAASPAAATVEDALTLFGQGPLAAVARIDDLQLTGLYATGRQQGFATFDSAQGPLSVVVGAEVRPGLVLSAVENRHAILRGNGSTWQLELKSPPDLLNAAGRAGPGSG